MKLQGVMMMEKNYVGAVLMEGGSGDAIIGGKKNSSPSRRQVGKRKPRSRNVSSTQKGCLVIVIDYCTGMEEMEDNGGIRNKKE
ncbi:hypothetical protein OIU76_028021 [Salix suchowensis]|nr:hypothetical protein OIU76_028021 [Salix suchowensis]